MTRWSILIGFSVVLACGLLVLRCSRPNSNALKSQQNSHLTFYGVAVDDTVPWRNNDRPMNGSSTTIAEYISKDATELFPSPDRTLRLTVEETPEYTPPDPSLWANVLDYGAVRDASVDSTTGIQAALDSGKPVVWIPGKVNYQGYRVSGTLTVPASVKLIIGPQPLITAEGTYFADKNAVKPVFRVAAESPDPLIFEGILVSATGAANGAIGMEHAAKRTCVLDVRIRAGVKAEPEGSQVRPDTEVVTVTFHDHHRHVSRRFQLAKRRHETRHQQTGGRLGVVA